jgi:hypothetical protein
MMWNKKSNSYSRLPQKLDKTSGCTYVVCWYGIGMTAFIRAQIHTYYVYILCQLKYVIQSYVDISRYKCRSQRQRSTPWSF